jgi:hypothetical protein
VTKRFIGTRFIVTPEAGRLFIQKHKYIWQLKTVLSAIRSSMAQGKICLVEVISEVGLFAAALSRSDQVATRNESEKGTTYNDNGKTKVIKFTLWPNG